MVDYLYCMLLCQQSGQCGVTGLRIAVQKLWGLSVIEKDTYHILLL